MRTISIIIPAHDEAAVISRCLEAVTTGARPREFEIVVVCNGCIDETAMIARRYPVRVLETPKASKVAALNLGDAEAHAFPRLYLDADVAIDAISVRRLAEALNAEGVLAAAPAMRMVFQPRTSWAVRAYYAFWSAMPYVTDGMIGTGGYAVSRAGRARFGAFPDVINDDAYFRLHFAGHERPRVIGAEARITAPRTLRDLIRIKTRGRLGMLQLRDAFPELFTADVASKAYWRVIATILRRPVLFFVSPIYAAVVLAARLRAARQLRTLSTYRWERDASSRA